MRSLVVVAMCAIPFTSTLLSAQPDFVTYRRPRLPDTHQFSVSLSTVSDMRSSAAGFGFGGNYRVALGRRFGIGATVWGARYGESRATDVLVGAFLAASPRTAIFAMPGKQRFEVPGKPAFDQRVIRVGIQHAAPFGPRLR